MKKTPGRKPIGTKALTSAQKMQRFRKRLALLAEAAKGSGYTPRMILINNEQFKAIGELEEGIGGAFNEHRLNEWIFIALREFLKAQITAGILDLKVSTLPDNCNELSMIQMQSILDFIRWEESQIEQQGNQS